MWYNTLKTTAQALGYGVMESVLLWFVARTIILHDVPLIYTRFKRIFLCSLAGLLFLLFAFFCPQPYWFGYVIFLCASVLVMYTDALAMLISRFTTLYLVPVGWLFAFNNGLYISFLDSIAGTLLGIIILGSVQKISERYYGHAGLGTGDIDYLACAGAFTGILGMWLTLMLGSFLASLWALSLILTGKFTRTTPFPFGSFLAAAGILVLLFKYQIASFLM